MKNLSKKIALITLPFICFPLFVSGMNLDGLAEIKENSVADSKKNLQVFAGDKIDWDDAWIAFFSRSRGDDQFGIVRQTWNGVLDALEKQKIEEAKCGGNEFMHYSLYSHKVWNERNLSNTRQYLISGKADWIKHRKIYVYPYQNNCFGSDSQPWYDVYKFKRITGQYYWFPFRRNMIRIDSLTAYLKPQPKPIPAPPKPVRTAEVVTLEFTSAKPDTPNNHFIFGVDYANNTRFALTKEKMTGVNQKCEVYDLLENDDKSSKRIFKYKLNPSLRCHAGEKVGWEENLWMEHPISHRKGLVLNDMVVVDKRERWFKTQYYDPFKMTNLVSYIPSSLFSRVFHSILTEELKDIDYPRPAVPEFKNLPNNEKYNLTFIRDYEEICTPNPNGYKKNCGFGINYFSVEEDEWGELVNWKNALTKAAQQWGKIPPSKLISEEEPVVWKRFSTTVDENKIKHGPIQEFNGYDGITWNVESWLDKPELAYNIYHNVGKFEIDDLGVYQRLAFPPEDNIVWWAETYLTRSYNKDWENDVIKSLPWNLNIEYDGEGGDSPPLMVTYNHLNWSSGADHGVEEDAITWDGKDFKVNLKSFTFDENAIYSGFPWSIVSQAPYFYVIEPSARDYLLQNLFAENANNPTNKPFNFGIKDVKCVFTINDDWSLSLAKVERINAKRKGTANEEITNPISWIKSVFGWLKDRFGFLGQAIQIVVGLVVALICLPILLLLFRFVRFVYKQIRF